MNSESTYQGNTFPFGKYKGESFEVVCNDRNYILYVFQNFDPHKFEWILERLKAELQNHNPELFDYLDSAGYLERY